MAKLPDKNDAATETEELFRDLALRYRAPEAPAATGRCLFCDEPLPKGRRFCDAYCRDDYDIRSRVEAGRGRP